MVDWDLVLSTERGAFYLTTNDPDENIVTVYVTAIPSANQEITMIPQAPSEAYPNSHIVLMFNLDFRRIRN